MECFWWLSIFVLMLCLKAGCATPCSHLPLPQNVLKSDTKLSGKLLWIRRLNLREARHTFTEFNTVCLLNCGSFQTVQTIHSVSVHSTSFYFPFISLLHPSSSFYLHLLSSLRYAFLESCCAFAQVCGWDWMGLDGTGQKWELWVRLSPAESVLFRVLWHLSFT